MRKIILVIVALAIGLNVSAKQKKRAKKTEAGDQLISIGLRHTACFGRCPDYIIEVNRNGVLTYTGLRFVSDSGVYTQKMGTKKAMEIINQATAYRLDTCQDRYESRVQDLPGIVYILKYRSKTKMIQNANFGPAVLGMMRGKMDSLVQFEGTVPGTLGHLVGSWHKTAGSHK